MWCGRYVISHTNPHIIFNIISTGKERNGDKNKVSLKVTKQYIVHIWKTHVRNTYDSFIRKRKYNFNTKWVLVWWCLMPLSRICQSYRGSQFIGGGNRSIQRKPPNCRKSLKNVMTECCIEYTSPWTGFYVYFWIRFTRQGNTWTIEAIFIYRGCGWMV